MSAQEIDHPPIGTPEYEAWAAQNRGPAIVATCWAFTAMATMFVIARVFTRIKLYNKLRSDDYWCIAGLVCGYLSTAFTTASVAHGNGRHMPTLTQAQQEKVIEYTMGGFCPGVLSFGFPKIAVVALLTRLLNPGKVHRWFLWGLAIWSLLTLGATRRNPFRSSTRGEKRYYEENPQHRRTLEASVPRPQPPTPNPIDMDMEETMIGSGDSQEAIVAPDKKLSDSDDSTTHNFSRPRGIPTDTGILRTDEVEVSYESDRTLDRSADDR